MFKKTYRTTDQFFVLFSSLVLIYARICWLNNVSLLISGTITITTTTNNNNNNNNKTKQVKKLSFLFMLLYWDTLGRPEETHKNPICIANLPAGTRSTYLPNTDLEHCHYTKLLYFVSCTRTVLFTWNNQSLYRNVALTILVLDSNNLHHRYLNKLPQ